MLLQCWPLLKSLTAVDGREHGEMDCATAHHGSRPLPPKKILRLMTTFGGLLTVLTPLCLAAYGAALIAIFVNRPVVIITTAETTLFTAPSVSFTCSCSSGLACRLNSTYLSGNPASDACRSLTASQNGVMFNGTRPVKLCYASRSSEGTTLHVPLGCIASVALESIADISFEARTQVPENARFPFLCRSWEVHQPRPVRGQRFGASEKCILRTDRRST